MIVRLIEPRAERFPTFKDVEPSELFVFESLVYVKVNATQAMVLGGGGELLPVNMHEQINLVYSVSITPEG